ncbi:hypothetical protein GW891_01215 [bacterium]|nr:hypothetical protein [bacterium]
MNKAQASRTVFLFHCSLRIDDNNINITAKAHGFILSQIAAGINIPKNFNLSGNQITFSISCEA